MEWESRLGRRLRVRDLYILSTVARSGSMAKAARQLAMSQPAVSEAIANLEHLLHVRLLDRSTQGVAPTIYADAMLKRSITVFDELKQSVRDVESLADPTTGEVRIGCSETIAATILPQTIERFCMKYPKAVLHVDNVPTYRQALAVLSARQYDLVLARPFTPVEVDVGDLNVESLYDDPLVVAAGVHNPLARRRKINLAELVDEPWIMQAPHTWNYMRMAEAFRACGLTMPRSSLVTLSWSLVAHFVSSGPYITSYPKSVVHRHSLKVLPVSLPVRPWPLAIMTLRNRTLSPVVERFVECAREVAKGLAKGQR
jgi:DNA-binding transcriptional LysR family regulator